MEEVHKVRLIERIKSCKKSIAIAKHDLVFWSEQLYLAVEELANDKQFNFDEIFKGEVK